MWNPCAWRMSSTEFMLKDSATHMALMSMDDEVSINSVACTSDDRSEGLCPGRGAMMATRRREFFAPVARGVLRFGNGEGKSFSPFFVFDKLLFSDLQGSPVICDRYGFEVKKFRFRGRPA